VLFPRVEEGLSITSRFDGVMAGIAVLAALMLFRFKQSVMRTLAVCAGVGLGIGTLS
jgi:preprotein translocase subunit SecF